MSHGQPSLACFSHRQNIEKPRWHFMIKAGLAVSAYDYTHTESDSHDFSLNPGLTLVFPLGGTSRRVNVFQDCDRSTFDFMASPGKAYLFFVRHSLSQSQNVVSPSVGFRALVLRVSRAFLRQFQLDVWTEKCLPESCLLKANADIWVGNLIVTQLIQDMVQKLFCAHDHFVPDPLALMAGSFNLLAATISALREPLFCERVKFLRDAKKIETARDLLLENLNKTWTIKALARQVGLNEKRLKEGFREKFGLPIYTFLQKSRLYAAREFLVSLDRKVIDIAMAVGYSNPSRFSELFSREFGMTPSVFRSNIQRKCHSF
jgi:AraC-like DNA-binding protein